jgi:uncharacterized membrane protein YfcA
MTAAAGLVLIAGFLVGATTLGGLIVVPALTEFASIEIDRAVAIASAAFIAPSMLAAAAAWHERSHRHVVVTAAGSALAGAAAGALLLAVVPGAMTMALIAALALVGGVRGLARDRWHGESARAPSVPVVASLSGVAGALSAITGTGGPVALWPLLGLAAQPVSICWVAALAVQLPVAIGATATNAWAGRLELVPAAVIAALLAIGFFAGRRVVARTSVTLLGRAASVMLLVIAAWIAAVLAVRHA